jgi:hypothetical protein
MTPGRSPPARSHQLHGIPQRLRVNSITLLLCFYLNALRRASVLQMQKGHSNPQDAAPF